MTTTLDTAPAPAVPRWIRRTAHLVPLLTLPSAVWRIALVLGLPITTASFDGPWWTPIYILGLAVVSEGTALLTLGLVLPWGEVAPQWIPFIGGRRVRPLAAVIPALTGAVFLTALWTWTFWRIGNSDFYDYFDGPCQTILVTACYLPLIGWGPALAVVAIAYWRRRRQASVR